MLNLSLEAANAVYTCASIVAITAALISACAGVITYMASSIQDRYADQAIANANSVSAQANNAAAQANAKTEILTKQNLELQIQVEKEKKERLILQKNLGKRHLSEAQVQNIKSTLSKASFTPHLSIEANRADIEAWEYAMDIARVFSESGAIVILKPTGIRITIGSSNTGLAAYIYDTQEKIGLNQIIKEIGIASEVRQIPRLHEDHQNIHASFVISAKEPYIKPPL